MSTRTRDDLTRRTIEFLNSISLDGSPFAGYESDREQLLEEYEDGGAAALTAAQKKFIEASSALMTAWEECGDDGNHPILQGYPFAESFDEINHAIQNWMRPAEPVRTVRLKDTISYEVGAIRLGLRVSFKVEQTDSVKAVHCALSALPESEGWLYHFAEEI